MVYLDNAATTVCKFPASAYDDNWGKANTPYKCGLNAKQAADDCREKVKECLGVKGVSVIKHATNSIHLSNASESHANGFFSGGANVAGILKVQGPVTKEQSM